MLGAIAGDVIGSPFEFKSIKDTDFENKTNQCTGTPIKNNTRQFDRSGTVGT